MKTMLNDLLMRAALSLTTHSPAFKRFLWRRWYQYLAGYQVTDWGFMNYGYASLQPDESPLALQPEDEPNRYSIQLYHYVAGRAALEGRDVLEVGCGRGGGASFVKRYLRPKQMTGVDFSPKAVRFCRERHRQDGLSFVVGDAEALPLEGDSFDAVLNVESSHCYGSMPAFLAQVRRVLRPGGHFLFADLRSKEDRGRLHQNLVDSGMTIVEQEDITANVVEALTRDSRRKLQLLEQHGNQRLMSVFRQFAAIEGSGVYEGFRNGSAAYLRYTLRK
jgi:ubiquinone/menaquinone biosynthesis C-methylase UbiE